MLSCLVLFVDDDGSVVGVLAALLTVFAVLFVIVLAILVAMVTIMKCKRGRSRGTASEHEGGMYV